MDSKLAHFSEALKEFKEHYILIGGNACRLVFEAVGQEFRLSQDLDIVILIESWDKNFARCLQEYFVNHGYIGKKSHPDGTNSGKAYRYILPDESDFLEQCPRQIELFSRIPDDFELPGDAHITPLPAVSELSDMSAILLDDDYYNLLKSSKILNGNLNVASPECLVVLKCKAWIENKSLYAAGKLPVNREGDVHKHALDVCSLLSILDADEVQLPKKLNDDVYAAAELYDAADEQAVLPKARHRLVPRFNARRCLASRKSNRQHLWVAACFSSGVRLLPVTNSSITN